MLEKITLILGACVKLFTTASFMKLPLDNIIGFMHSSEPVLLLFLFSFVVGETQRIIPAILVTALYFYIEIIPRKLRLGDKLFQNNERV